MILSVGSLAFRRLGVPWRAIWAFLDTLRNMKHFIRTAHGDSESYYEGTPQKPLQGGGQGNGAAGPMWIAISVILLSIIATVPFNATIVSAISLATITMSAIMYVDDTDLLIIGNSADTTPSLTNKAQTMVTKWCSALWITGGCLRPKKCWWYLVGFVWKRDGTWRYASAKETEADIWIPDENKVDQRIDRHEVSVGKKTLGTILAPDGNNVDQLKQMEKATSEWASKIRRSYMTKFSVDVSVRTTIMKTLTYPTAALTITEKECDKLMSKIKIVALPKMGMCRTISHVYLYGLIRYQGNAFPNLYTELCIDRLKLLLKHGGRSTQLGTSLEACLEGHQLELGTDTAIFDLDFATFGFLATDSIIKHTWEMLSTCGLHIDTTHKLPWLCRQHDSFLMEEIISKASYNEKELTAINRCRMHLNVITVSDITDGDGLQISAEMYMGNRDPDRVSNWRWPVAPAPPRRDWDIWRGALDSTILRTDTRFLRKPLGVWTDEPHQRWKWYVSPDDDNLYEVRENTTYVHPIIGRKLRNVSCHMRTETEGVLPENARRTTVEIADESCIYTQGSAPMAHRTNTTHHNCPPIWAHAPQWIPKSLMKDCFLPDSWATIATSLRNGTCVAVTDGSFAPDEMVATACWIIEGDNGSNRCKGAAHTPGTKEEMDAYRAEIFGIYCLLICIKYICLHESITEGKVTVVCDCLGALTRAILYDNRPTTSHPNFDLLWSIFDLRDEIPITVVCEHVYGHQDTARINRPLTRLEILNCEADRGAKDYLTHVLYTNHTAERNLFGRQWRLRHGQSHIYSNLRSRIYDVRHGKRLQRHIMKKKSYTLTIFNSIDWAGIQAAGKTLSRAEQTWLTKHVSRFNPVGRQMKRREYWLDSRCPRCGCTDEDSNHIILCPHATSVAALADSALNLEYEMISISTHPIIVACFTMTVHDRGNATFQDHLPTMSDDTSPELHNLITQAAIEQDRIGYYPIFEGHISNKWRVAQDFAFREQPNCKRSSATWTKKFITQLYNMTRKMWKHRNDALFNKQQAGDSYKRRKMILNKVRTQLKIGFALLRIKDKKSTCTDYTKLKTWTTPMLEAWLKNINTLRERSHRYCHENIEDDYRIKKDDLYIERKEKMKRCSSPKFWRWRLKHHTTTLTQYIHSKLELERQFKRQRS